tara:strand:- start:4994 stop:5899 length:906 start_codon:yes stop_codon:yes gene_type:complete
MDSTMLKANAPAPSETLSDIILKHAIAGNLGGLRKVEPSEHKVLCYSYMSGRPSSNCSHWIKPGDYVEEYMPVISADFFSFRDKIPTSAKAVAIAIEEDGENVPTCLACLCNQYEQTIIRKVGHWIDYNFRMESMAEHLNEFFGTSDIDIEELFNGPYVAYEYCESDLDDHFDPLKSEFFEQWSESIWSRWYESSILRLVLSKRESGVPMYFDWASFMEKLEARTRAKESLHRECQDTFSKGPKTRDRIQAEAEILLFAIKHHQKPSASQWRKQHQPPASVIQHLTCIVNGTPEWFMNLIR